MISENNLYPVCACCGDAAVVRRAGNLSPYRCAKHVDRNPCAIEGCERTRAAPLMADGTPWLANNQALCSDHWRRFVPPRSALRRTYHRFWRLAKRQGGWDNRLERRFVRFWKGLVAQARRKATGGDIDIAEIDRMFGWNDVV